MHKRLEEESEGAAKLRSQGGYTLSEVLATVAVLGVLMTIAVIVFLGILEQRRVDAATDQLSSELRLAHSRATSQLTDFRVVMVLDRGDASEGPDYYVVRLKQPYDGANGGVPEAGSVEPRSFDGNVLVKNVITPGGSLTDDRRARYWLSPETTLPENVRTRTVELNSDGTTKFYQGVSGSVCVTSDGRPQNMITAISATSALRVRAGSPCDTSASG